MRKVTLELTLAQLECLNTVLAWADSGGDHSELFEAAPKAFRGVFDRLCEKVRSSGKLSPLAP